MTSAIVMAAGSAAIVAFIVIAGIIESRMKRNRPINDFRRSCAYHNSAQDKHMRILGNLRTPRSISSVKGGL